MTERQQAILDRLDRIEAYLLQLKAKKEEEAESKVEHYRFGGITKEAKAKYQLFIRKCVQGAGKSFAMTPEAAALQADISVKTKDIFLSHLLRFNKDGKPLVEKLNNYYYSNFDAETIISFLFSKDD